MVILSRKPNEGIIVELPNGEQIYIAVTEVNGNQVRIGVDAPQDVLVLREELVEK